MVFTDSILSSTDPTYCVTVGYDKATMNIDIKEHDTLQVRNADPSILADYFILYLVYCKLWYGRLALLFNDVLTFSDRTITCLLSATEVSKPSAEKIQ